MRVKKMPKKLKDRPKATITGKAKSRKTAKVKARPEPKAKPTQPPPIHISEEEQAKHKELMEERRIALRDALIRRRPAAR